MTRSIRSRVAFAVLVLVAPVFLVGSYLLYRQSAHAVRDRFDHELATAARVLADLAEVDASGYEFELGPTTERVLGGSEPLLVELRLPDGRLLHRSRALGDHHLPSPRSPLGAVEFADVTLPGGTARTAILRFLPRSDLRRRLGEGDALTLSVARTTAPIDRLLHRLALWFLAIGAGLLLLATVLGLRAVGLGLAPLLAVGREIEGLDPNRLDHRVSTDLAPTELRPLIDRLNQLLGRLESAFARERRFSADVAHELRTPLTVLRTEVEVALRRPADRADDREVLRGAVQTIEEMSAMVEALLRIARAETAAATIHDRIDLGELVDRCWQRERERAAGREITLRADIAPGTTVVGDPELVRAIVQNLLANAVAHGDGEIVATAAPADGLLLAVDNRAPGLDPDAVSHMFDRFWRGDPSRTGAGHSGLGLALVRAAARSLGLTASATLDGDRLSVRITAPDQAGSPRAPTGPEDDP